MFLHLSVSDFVHSGCVCIPARTGTDTPLLGRHPPCIPACIGADSPTATAADGTHPTGMRSCLICVCCIEEKCIGNDI